jgi:hypothetical protein
MSARGRSNEAAALIEEGLVAADAHDLPFERRLLLDLRARVERDDQRVVELHALEVSANRPGRLVRTAPP